MNTLFIASQGLLARAALQTFGIAAQGLLDPASVPPPQTRPRGWDDGGRRRPLYVYEEAPPEAVRPSQAQKRRRVTREAVEAAIGFSWAGDWTLAEALDVLPKTVPVTFAPPPLGETELTATAIAMYLAMEAERKRQEDEDDIEMLLLTQ